MTENIDDTQQFNNINIVASPRSKLIYDYTEKLYKAKSDNLNVLNIRLGLLLGSSATLLKFVFDLQSKNLYIKGWYCYSCIGFKLLSVIFIIASICLCLLGLESKEIGIVVDPKKLMEDKWYESIEEKQRAYIINTWIESIDAFEKSVKEKSISIKRAITFLVFALIFFAIDGIALMFI